jgi:hypothetical protein
MIKNSTYQRLIQVTFACVLVLGLFLRFYQYLMGRSLWEDETHLALNFMNRGFLGLAKPLDYIQGAPILFLWLVKAVVKIFGYGELAFRAVPFVSSVLTLPLFYFITKQLTGNKLTALIAFFIFSVNLSLIYFSSELKQYAVEVAVYLLMVFLAIGNHKLVTRNRNFLLAIAGSLCIFLSSTAFIVLFCIACNFILNWYAQKRINKNDLKIFVPWIVAFLINYFLFIHNHPSTTQQRINFAFAFCPTDPLSCEFVSFLKKTIEETFFTLLLYVSKAWGFSYGLLLIFLVAIRHIIVRKQHTLFLLVCLPVLLHLGLSALKIYPFWYRLILYLVPCFIILMSLGTTLIAEFLKKKLHMVAGIAVVIYCSYFFTKESISRFPLWFREIKPGLNYVNHLLPTTHVYITDPVHAYTYYYKRGYAQNKIYREVPWEIDPPEFYDMVFDEDSNYVLFYSTFNQWGYTDVLEDLSAKGLILRTFKYKGYAVSEVKPLQRDSTLAKRIDHTYFDPTLSFEEEKAIALWTGSISSSSVKLKAGKYRISILSRGTPVKGVFPKNQLFINDQLLGEFNSYEKYTTADFPFETKNDLEVSFRIKMLNDTISGKEDRNSFIKVININTVEK